MKSPQEWVSSYQDFWIKGELGLIKAGPSLDKWIDAIQTDARTDLREALTLLDLAMHQGEYGVGEDVRKRYEKLKERHKNDQRTH